MDMHAIQVARRIHALKGGITLMIVNLSDARKSLMELAGTTDVEHPSVLRYTNAIDKLLRIVAEDQEVDPCRSKQQCEG